MSEPMLNVVDIIVRGLILPGVWIVIGFVVADAIIAKIKGRGRP
jgi:hypothetical protein